MEGRVVARFVEQSPNDDAGMIAVAPDQITYRLMSVAVKG
jgi:hypothetical protein